MTQTYEQWAWDKATGFELVMTKNRAIEILNRIREAFERQYDNTEGSTVFPALDFETTALSPEAGRVRLSCIFDPFTSQAILLDHFFCGHFKDLAPYFVGPVWSVYNAKFETRWFDAVIPNQVDLLDVDFMAKVCLGGHHTSLARMCKRDLKIELDKELQNSDWHIKELTTAQYQYGAFDAVLTFLLWDKWAREIRDRPLEEKEAMEEAMWTFQDAVRPTVECEDTGIGLDPDYHKVNIARWEMKQETMLHTLRRFTPKSMLPNLNSNKQVSDFLKTQLGESAIEAWPKTDKTEQLKLDRATLRAFAKRLPYPLSRWLNALASLHYYNKYLSTYGETLLTKHDLSDKGTVDFRLNIAQAATGRYSSSSINIQNIPRSPVVRQAFLPPPPFEYLVVADYSSIEVRVLAELSGDEALIHDAIHGDVHATMAAARMGIPVSDFIDKRFRKVPGFSEARSKAKAGTFRLTYGAGAGAISDSLGSSLEEAEDFMRKWAAQYPKAFNYRHKMFDHMMQTQHLPVVSGRKIFVPRMDRELPVAANYPIQGAAADVMYRGMYHVQRLRDEFSTPDLIRLVATVHDELLLACNEPQIELAKQIIVKGMEQGWLDVFPDTDLTGLVEAGHGVNWGAAK